MKKIVRTLRKHQAGFVFMGAGNVVFYTIVQCGIPFMDSCFLIGLACLILACVIELEIENG